MDNLTEQIEVLQLNRIFVRLVISGNFEKAYYLFHLNAAVSWAM